MARSAEVTGNCNMINIYYNFRLYNVSRHFGVDENNEILLREFRFLSPEFRNYFTLTIA